MSKYNTCINYNTFLLNEILKINEPFYYDDLHIENYNNLLQVNHDDRAGFFHVVVLGYMKLLII